MARVSVPGRPRRCTGAIAQHVHAAADGPAAHGHDRCLSGAHAVRLPDDDAQPGTPLGGLSGPAAAVLAGARRWLLCAALAGRVSGRQTKGGPCLSRR